jgi:hypothetical protein
LRDAQFLSWKTFKKLEAKMGKDTNNSTLAAEMLQKANEVASKTNAASHGSNRADLSKLLPELLYLAFVLAEKNGVSLEETFMQTMDDYILGLVG